MTNLSVITNVPQDPEYRVASSAIGNAGLFTEDYSKVEVPFEESTEMNNVTKAAFAHDVNSSEVDNKTGIYSAWSYTVLF